ncbi:DUF6514 family protein [Oscillospiraceae bacterium 38-13]
MVQYLPVENKIFSPDTGWHRTFGLRVMRMEAGQDLELMILPDISTDFTFVLRLAGLFTEKQLDPIHLLDVLEDFL